MRKKIILASGSPRRREILKNIGLDFETFVSNADESAVSPDGIPVGVYVQELAMLKAASSAGESEDDAIFIGADTVVSLDGKILTKPSDDSEAFEMLKMLSGKAHEVYTGICVLNKSDMKSVCRSECTRVVFSTLSDEMINAYIKTGEPSDKAGAYGIQGKGALLIEKIEGDYFNVVGLPIKLLSEILRDEFDYDMM